MVAAPSPCARDVHGCTRSAAGTDPSLDAPKLSRAAERKEAWYGRWYTCCGGTPGGTPGCTPSCTPGVVLVAAGICLLCPHRIPDQLCLCCAPAAALEVAADAMVFLTRDAAVTALVPGKGNENFMRCKWIARAWKRRVPPPRARTPSFRHRQGLGNRWVSGLRDALSLVSVGGAAVVVKTPASGCGIH